MGGEHGNTVNDTGGENGVHDATGRDAAADRVDAAANSVDAAANSTGRDVGG